MIRRGLLTIVPLIPVTAWAGLPAPGPPSTEGRDFGVAVAIFAAGVVGLLILRLRRNAGAESPEGPPVPGKEKVLRVVCWLLVIGGPTLYVLRSSAVAAERRKVIQTMADMRRIAAGWEARAQELHQTNSAGITFVERNAKVPAVLPYAITSEQAASLLVPQSMDSFPMRDVAAGPRRCTLASPL